MNHSPYLIFYSCLLLLFSCTSSQSETSISTNLKAENPITKEVISLDGYWIMSEYIDGILSTRSIQEHRRKPLTWSALILEIKRDSMNSNGLLQGNINLAISENIDSLTLIRGEIGSYKLSYSEATNTIRAECISKRVKSGDSFEYTFRRLKNSERRLTYNDKEELTTPTIKTNFYSFFIDSLISGKYAPLDSNLNFMRLESDGRTTGFKGFNKYFIHTYFGTSHPFTPEDAIIFTDTTITNPPNQPPINNGVFSWKFKGDTLILTEMVTKNHEQFFLGSKAYVYLKKCL